MLNSRNKQRWTLATFPSLSAPAGPWRWILRHSAHPLGCLWAHPLAHLPSPLAAPTPCTAEALQCCHAKTNHVKSHLYTAQLHEQWTTLPLSCYTKAKEALRGVFFCCLLPAASPGHREDSPYRRATSVATARVKICCALGEHHASNASEWTAPKGITASGKKQIPVLGDILGILGMVLCWQPLGARLCLVSMSICSIQHGQGGIRLLIGQI